MKNTIWNPKPVKNLFSLKSINLSPIKMNIKKPKKQLTYPEAVIRYPRLTPFGDADKDGKINMFDCRPFNKMKHTTITFKNKKIRIQTPKQIRPLANILNKKGRTYVVGGFVRDTVLQRPPKDVDVEVHGMTPEDISKELQSGGYNVDEVGKSFGVLKVSPKTGSRKEAIDVSVPRTDSTGRKPKVELLSDVTPKEAAKRRDFTINAIMYDTKEDKIIDPYEGLVDLEKGKIKAVSDKSFSDDPLRVVRAAQFASRFDFDIDPETKEAAKRANMKELSGERIREELEKVTVKAKKPSRFFRAMDEMGQLSNVFPEVSNMKGVKQDPKYHPEGDVFEHTMQVIDKVAESKDRNPELILMGVLHDTGKAKVMQVDEETGRIRAIGHAEESAKIAKEFMNRLKYSNEEKHEIVSLVEHHMEPHHLALTNSTKFRNKNRLLVKVAGGYDKLANNPEKAIKRYKKIIAFAKQDNPNPNYAPSYEELEKIPLAEKYHREAKGEDLVTKGYKGKEIGQKLEELYKNQIANIKEGQNKVEIAKEKSIEAHQIHQEAKDKFKTFDDSTPFSEIERSRLWVEESGRHAKKASDEYALALNEKLNPPKEKETPQEKELKELVGEEE